MSTEREKANYHPWPQSSEFEPSGISGELPDERALHRDFEAWALSKALPINNTNGHYDWYDVRMRWEGYQAGRAAQAAAVKVPEGWTVEAKHGGASLTSPDGTKWGFGAAIEPGGADRHVREFLLAIAAANTPTPGDKHE